MKGKNIYLNAVLTLIASLLIVLVVQNQLLIRELHHTDKNTSLYSESVVQNANYPTGNSAMVPLNADGSINVRLQQDQVIDVNIDNIDTRDVLNINLTKVDGYSIKGNRVPVKSN